MSSRRHIAALAALMLAISAPAAEPANVDTIVSGYVAARGGLAKIRSVQTLRQRGRAVADAGRQALVLRELKLPGKIRFEFTVQGVTGAYVSDGRRGWQVSPFEGDMEPRPLPEQAFLDAMEQADFEGPLVDWRAKGHRIELVGREIVAGRESFKLKLTLKGGAERFDYIDAKSHQLVRTDSTRQVRGQPVKIETSFGDYKKTQGVLFPRTIEVAAVGRPQRLRVFVDTIEVNPPLSDARFERPAGVSE